MGKGMFDTIALLLVVVGGLSWGLVGAFEFNLVTAVFGTMPILVTVTYIFFGVAALYVAYDKMLAK